jgi:hemolysin activation/secretion protein
VFAQAGPFTAAATPPTPADIAEEGLRRAAERERELRRDADTRPDGLRPTREAAASATLPDEQPCFVISEIVFNGPDAVRFRWLDRVTEPFLNQCAGVEGLRRITGAVDTALMEQGYVTSRVSLPAQNLSSGQLQLQLHIGRVAEVRMVQADALAESDTAWGTWRNAFVPDAGERLNLRDIEQGLEQMKRLPSQEVTTTLEPGSEPDTSVIVIRRKPAAFSERLRGGVTLDNAGSDSLGRAQLSVFAALDNPLGVNDIVSANFSSNAESVDAEHRSQSASLSYSIPWGYSTFLLNRSESRFAQRVPLTTTSVLSSGESRSSSLQWQHVTVRTASTKFSVNAALSTRRARSFLDDSENVVQRRRTTAFESGAGFTHLLGESTRIEAEVGYRRGMPWLQAQDDFPDEVGALTLRPKIWTLDAHVASTWRIAAQTVQLQSALRAQHTRSTTLSIDQIAIGGRSSVRGFDGDNVLIAESGWVLRNEASLPLVLPWAPLRSSMYLGADAGRVWGPSAANLVGHGLAGAALGLRGQWHRFQFDLAVSAPVHQPEGFKTRPWSPYLSVTAAF